MTPERALEIARSGNFSCIADMIQFAAQEQAEADAQVCDTQRREAVTRERERLAADPWWIIQTLIRELGQIKGADPMYASPIGRKIADALRRGGKP